MNIVAQNKALQPIANAPAEFGVKRSSKNIRLSKLNVKAVKLEQKLKGYEIEYRDLLLDDL